jgi:uncharacterized protein (TIGR02001 family)
LKKLIGAALAAGATMACAGAAQGEVSANIQLTTNYVFRGVSLSNNNPAVQGGFDWNNTDFYAGIWASSLGAPKGAPAAPLELDLYAGWTPVTGPLTWDLGVIFYNYPDADNSTNSDFYELRGSGVFKFNEHWSAGASIYYAPSNYGATGRARYWEFNGEYAFNDMLHFSGAFGNQQVDHPGGPGTARDDYDTWNIGAILAWRGFQFDLRYNDTNIKAGAPIEAYTYGPESYDASTVLTIKRQL